MSSFASIAVKFRYSRNLSQVFIKAIGYDEEGSKMWEFPHLDWPLKQHEIVDNWLTEKQIQLTGTGKPQAGYIRLTLAPEQIATYIWQPSDRFHFNHTPLNIDAHWAEKGLYSVQHDPIDWLANWRKSHKVKPHKLIDSLIAYLPIEHQATMVNKSLKCSSADDFCEVFIKYFTPKHSAWAKSTLVAEFDAGSLAEHLDSKFALYASSCSSFDKAWKLIKLGLAPDQLKLFENWSLNSQEQVRSIAERFDRAEAEKTKSKETFRGEVNAMPFDFSKSVQIDEDDFMLDIEQMQSSEKSESANEEQPSQTEELSGRTEEQPGRNEESENNWASAVAILPEQQPELHIGES